MSHTLSLKLGGEGLIIILNGGSSFIIVTHGSRDSQNPHFPPFPMLYRLSKALPTNFHPTRKALKLASLLVLEYVSFRVWFISTQFGLLYRIHILTPSFVNALSTLSFHASTEPPSSPFFWFILSFSSMMTNSIMKSINT